MNATAPLFEPITSGEARTWTPPQGRADIAPSRYGRIEGDGYLTIDAHRVVPALLRSVPVESRVLEPAAGRGLCRLSCAAPVSRSRRLIFAVTRILSFPTSRRAISAGWRRSKDSRGPSRICLMAT
jgi:hypothetical protein